ncbi:MAG: lacA 2 [Armatimonadetes bacterium]|jgi:maltose O-acetyltransferase|nr:lacA 2 [Armatimonadota bacterium]
MGNSQPLARAVGTGQVAEERLLARIRRDPAASLGKAWLMLISRWKLRKCTSAGGRSQVKGRLIVNNAGRIHVGSTLHVHANHVAVELAATKHGTLTIGDRVAINSGCSICAAASVTIGDRVGIGNYSLIMDTDFHTVGDFDRRPQPEPIVIEDDVWLASRVTVLKGVTIGRGSVITTGSVVTRNIPPYSLAGGNPARVISTIPHDEARG